MMATVHLINPFIFYVIVCSGTLFCSADVLSTPPFLQQILTNAQNDSSFNQTYLRSGCFVRAHWLAEKISRLGYTPIKIFIHSENLQQKIQMQFSPGENTQWVFHVAVGYQDENKQVWVLDPVLSKRVESIEGWKAIIQLKNPTLVLNLKFTSAITYHFDSVVNAEWEQIAINGAFSENAMTFINDAMADLFIWEEAEQKYNHAN